eukprot:gene15970-7302_t
MKNAEIRIAVGIACHSSIIAIDHLSEIMVEHSKVSTISKINLHRTKCSQLLTKVILPVIKHELKEDVKGKGLAVLIDETTDVAFVDFENLATRGFNLASWPTDDYPHPILFLRGYDGPTNPPRPRTLDRTLYLTEHSTKEQLDLNSFVQSTDDTVCKYDLLYPNEEQGTSPSSVSSNPLAHEITEGPS